MKKFIIIIGIVFIAQTALNAQITTGNVVFNANLGSTLNLLVTGGGTQTINFLTAADYNLGVTEGAGIASGTSTITVEATQDWLVNIRCPDFAGTGPTVGESIVIDNLGVYCVATGSYTFATGESTCTCQIPGDALGLDNADQLLIGNGTGNMGDATNNAFTLHWEMGTMQSGNPTNPMHATSMFDQMAAGDFIIGTYTTTAVLTLVGL